MLGSASHPRPEGVGDTMTQQPNSFILSGPEISVTYLASGITGKPTLTYEDRHLRKTFTGPEIRTVTDESTELVSVSIVPARDSGYTSFTLFIPRFILVHGTSAHVATVGLIGVHRPTVDSPTAGQLDTYQTVRLTGTACLITTTD